MSKNQLGGYNQYIYLVKDKHVPADSESFPIIWASVECMSSPSSMSKASPASSPPEVAPSSALKPSIDIFTSNISGEPLIN